MNEREIFAQAIEIESASERLELIQNACGQDEKLINEVLSLVNEHFRNSTFILDKADHFVPQMLASQSYGPGAQIGRYKLLQQIGEGGMGEVFMAEQKEPVRRRVALKLIKKGRTDKQVLARFEAERQALAMMEHQNIARVLDAGAADDGTPFFVMELVQGEPITHYCDKNKLTPNERLQLFIPVCEAIQHAHHKGIVHRDLKPANVLVQIFNGKPMAKVIDFGLAKALQHQTQLTDKTLFTEFGQVVGTVQYMSPEQAALDAIDVDARTDIYSLGVMLYELLAGSTPIEMATLKEQAILKVLEIIRSQDAPRPSHRLSSSIEKLDSISQQRHTQPTKLQKMLQGDLDWIVMKAIEKDRTRRYETANEFASDIRRYLDGDAVVARPPSTAYKLSKFVNKNRGVVVGLAAVAASLLIGIGLACYGLVQAKVAVELGKKETLNARQAEQDSRESAKRSADVLQIIVDSFGSINPYQGGKADMSAKDVLLHAKASLESSDLDDVGKARLLRTLNNAFFSIGDAESSIWCATKEVAIQKSLFGDDHPNTLLANRYLANGYTTVGQIDKALQIHEKNLKLLTEKKGLEDAMTLSEMNNLANSYGAAGRSDESISLHRKTLELRTKVLGLENQDTLGSMANLGTCYYGAKDFEKAMQLFHQALKLQTDSLGPDYPDTLDSAYNLANCYLQMGQTEKALSLHKQTLELKKSKFGESHPRTLQSRAGIAWCFEQLGRNVEALQLREQVFEIQKTNWPGERYTLQAELELARSYFIAGRIDEAETMYKKVIELLTEMLGPTHRAVVESKSTLAYGYSLIHQFDKASEVYSQILATQKKKTTRQDDPLTTQAIDGLVWCKVATQQSGDQLTDELLEQIRTVFSVSKTRNRRHYGRTLAVAEYRKGHYQKAIIAAQVTISDKTSLDFPIGLATLALCHHQLGNLKEAEEYRNKFNAALNVDAFRENLDCQSFAEELTSVFGPPTKPSLTETPKLQDRTGF